MCVVPLLDSPSAKRVLAGGGDEVEQFPPSSADVNIRGVKHEQRVMQVS